MNLNPEPSTNISVEKWVELLKQVNDSQSERNGQTKGHTYLVIQNGNYETTDQLQSKVKKLASTDIVAISKIKLQEMVREYQAGKLETKRFLELTAEIRNITQGFIEARNRPSKKFTRKFIIVAAFISIIGIPLIGIPLLLAHRKFAQEVKQLKETIKEAEVALAKTMTELKDPAAALAKYQAIQEFIKNIPDLLREVEEFMPIDEQGRKIQEDLIREKEKEMEKIQFADGHSLDCPSLFLKDIRRGTTFKRRDEIMKIQDENSISSLEKEEIKKEKIEGKTFTKEQEEERILKANIEAIKKCLSSDNDSEWEKVLQLVANQLSLNNLSSIPKIFFMNKSKDYDLSWKGDNKVEYFIDTKFSDSNLPPIELEILRDKVNNKITQVNVHVKGELDIVRSVTGSENAVELIVYPKAIRLDLKYSVDKDLNVTIIHRKLEASVNK